MPRRARQLKDGGTYHVMARGNNGQLVFRHDEDYPRYLRLLAMYARLHEAQVFHFALLPTHVHLLVHVVVGLRLSHLMRGLNLSYTLYVHRRYQYRGHLWRGRFKSRLLDQENDLLSCGRYIELHPVRSGLVQDPGAYAWSSYRTYTDAVFSPIITPNPAYVRLGPTPGEQRVRYRRFVQDKLDKTQQHAGHLPSAQGRCCPGLDGEIGFATRCGRPRAGAVALMR